MREFIDLHIHTNASDGSLSPRAVVEEAARIGLKAIAVTDHDTADGLPEALEWGEKLGMEIVPGIELSVDYKEHGVHILAYFVDAENPHLQELLAWVISEREKRNEEIAAAMRADGYDVTIASLREMFPGAIIGRPHFAAALVKAGAVSSVPEGFEKYLNRGGKYYRKRKYIPMDMAFETIAKCGAKAVMAHPLQYKFSHDELMELTKLLKEKGLSGMECVYAVYTPEQREYLMGIAEEMELCVTAGSDFHGSGKPHIQIGTGCGDMKAPYELLEKLKNI
ncbi:MAG: PHP domain-containing protein [Oscillospiraceae bacterium]|nr:PHP domain-containing protein [Oscillospiraceae bacterium]